MIGANYILICDLPRLVIVIPQNTIHTQAIIEKIYILSHLVLYFLFQLASVAITGVGIYANIEKDKYLPDSGINTSNIADLDIYDLLFDLTVLFIAVGVALFIVSFLGCIGALRENTCFLNLVSLFVFLCLYTYIHAS